MIEFTAYGEPKPKGSARGFAIPMKAGGRPVLGRNGQPRFRVAITHDNPGTSDWQRTVRVMAQQHRGEFIDSGPVEVEVEFGLLRPPSVSPKRRLHPTTRPDLDKL